MIWRGHCETLERLAEQENRLQGVVFSGSTHLLLQSSILMGRPPHFNWMFACVDAGQDAGQINRKMVSLKKSEEVL